MLLNTLWVEKYRPTSLDNYVFTNQSTKELTEYWIKERSIPHVLLHGPAGTGKTTLAKLIVAALNVDSVDVLQVNGSKEGRKIDWLRDKLDMFCQTMPYGESGFKIVMIDEADYLAKDSVQPALRNLMEDYASNVRFLMTCNYPNRLIPPLRSRCQELQIDQPDQGDFISRIGSILDQEQVLFEDENLAHYVMATYPDMRKCLNLIQSNVVNRRLNTAGEGNSSTQDFRLDAVSMIKSGRLREARQLICSQVRSEEVEEVFRWAYDNLELWSRSEEGQDEAILIIRRGLVNHVSCSDAEINLSASLTELLTIGK